MTTPNTELDNTTRLVQETQMKSIAAERHATSEFMGEDQVSKIQREMRKARGYRPLGFTPRVLRLRDAPRYLGMNKNYFNERVRPYVPEIPIGDRGICFDVLDFDKWLDAYKARNSRPGQAIEGGIAWDSKKSRQGSLCEGTPGISRRQSQVREFEKAVKQAKLKRRNGT